MPWPFAGQDGPSSSQLPVTWAAPPSGFSSSSSSDKEFDDCDQDIHTVVQQLDATGQALRNECREAERLRESLSSAETMLGAADEETAIAKAVAVAAQAKLAGMPISIFPVPYLE